MLKSANIRQNVDWLNLENRKARENACAFLSLSCCLVSLEMIKTSVLITAPNLSFI